MRRSPTDCVSAPDMTGPAGHFPWVPTWRRQLGGHPERLALPLDVPFDFRHLFGMQFPPIRLTDSVEVAVSSDLALPALRIGAELLEIIRSNLVTVITGSTGCGKTTIVPLLLLLQHKNARLLIALPRRIATQMAAERLRQLLGDDRLGQTVGYHVGHEEACKSDETRLLFVTAGMLRKYVTGALRQLHMIGQTSCSGGSTNEEVVSGHKLRSIFPYDFVLVDEVHERTIDCDMALLLLKCLAVRMTVAAVRAQMELPAFRIVVMSATISANDFSTFLAGERLNIFQAEHAAWMEKTCLLRVKGALQVARLNAAHSASPKAPAGLTAAEKQLYEIRERERLIRWARSLVTPLNELACLWRTRRSKDLAAVFQEQHLSMPSRASCKRQHWRQISGTARARGNCVEVARHTNFPVEELFWDDIVDLARFSMTATAADLLDIASPTLLRYMGIDPDSGGILSTVAQQGATDERKALTSLSRRSTFHHDSPCDGDAGTDLDEEGEVPSRGDEFCFEKPRLNYWCVERKPEISRMEQALDQAKAEASVALSSVRDDPHGCSRTDIIRESEGPVQLRVDLQILRIHRDAETDELKHAKQHAPRSTCMKIILATNIAESSITFVDVCIVIDFALVKEKHVHAVTKAHRLQLRWASRAALDQRKGRTGRVREGAYVCLIPRELFMSLEPFPLPELQRLPLEDVLADVMAALPGESTDASLFFLSQAQDPPDVGRVYEALCSMEASGALNLRSQSSLFTQMTPLGHLACLLALPVKVARIILLSRAYGVFPAGLWAASLLLSDRQTVFECQPRGVKTSKLSDVELLRWMVARSARLAFAGRLRNSLFPEAAQRMQVQHRSKCEPGECLTKKIDDCEQAPWLQEPPCTGSDDASSFIWGEFIPCDICVDVMAMLHLHEVHGNRLYQLQSHMTASAEKLHQGDTVPPRNCRHPYSVKEMRQLRRFLALSGVSIQGVADVASQHQAISRKLARVGILRSAESCRAMPPSFSMASPSNEFTSKNFWGRGIEGLVWRLQLVLASACMPFGFSRVRDSLMQTPFNLGQQPKSHFAFNILCHESFRERPDLRCCDALVEAAKQSCWEASTSSWRFQSEARGSPTSFSSKGALDGSSRKRLQCRYSQGSGEHCIDDSVVGCVCSITFPEDYSEVPSLRQGHLESEANSKLGNETELNKQRWSQQLFFGEMGLILRSSCSTVVLLRLAVILLRETDPLALFSDSAYARHPSGDAGRGAGVLLYNSFRTWVNRQRLSHAKLSAEFEDFCSRLETSGLLEDSQVRAWCAAQSQSSGLTRFAAYSGARSDPMPDFPSVGKSNDTVSSSEWLQAMRNLEGFICRLILFAAQTRTTRRLLQLMYTALLERPRALRQLLCEQQGNWPIARSEIDMMDRAREELTAIFMHPSFTGRLASCLGPLQFFSLSVKNFVPLSDLLLCEGWDFGFKGILPGAPLGPLIRVQELLGPLLSSGCRALLPTDIQGVAEAVKEFYSSKQVQARQQQARGDSKRAKGRGLLRHLEEQKQGHMPTASVWASLVEEAVDSLAASAATALERLRSTTSGDSAVEPTKDVGRLLKAASKATQIVSAYWRCCGLVHAQPNSKRIQLLIFGDSHRRALLQWIHRATDGINMRATGKRQGELRGPELECISQPLWASMLPFADPQSPTPRVGIGSNVADIQSPSTVPHESSVEEEQIEEQLLEAAEGAQRAAGGGFVSTSFLEDIISLATSAANRLLDIQQAEFDEAELLLESRSKLQRPKEGPARPVTTENPSSGKLFQMEAGTDWKDTVKDSSNASKPSYLNMKDSTSRLYSVKAEAGPGVRHCHHGESLRRGEESRACCHSLHSCIAGSNEVSQRCAGDEDDFYSSDREPVFSVSHRFFKSFLALDEDGRRRRRQHCRPSTARVCRISEQSILHSNGPFYPGSYSREFLLLGLSEWDTSAGLASGGSDVSAASLLPPLPHLEELLLFLLAPVVCMFLSKRCLCYCCKCCPCNPDLKEEGQSSSAKGRVVYSSGDGARGPSHTYNDSTRADCCPLCLRGAVCYAVVSFGGFREFGLVPRFLWKDADISLLNDARSVMSDVFKQQDIQFNDKCSTDTPKWAETNFGDDENQASDSDDYSVSSDSANDPDDRFQSRPSAVGACLDRILEQLLRPKSRLQHKQRMGATTATAYLRSRARKPHGRGEQPNLSTQNHSTPADDRGAPCWEKLDRAKHQQGHAEGGIHASLSPILIFDLHGAEMDTPGRTTALRARCCTRISQSRVLAMEANSHREQTPKMNVQISEHSDFLAMAIRESLTFLHSPRPSKTAELPEGAKPCMWGLPVSLLILRHFPQHPSLSEMQRLTTWKSLSASVLPDYAGKLLLQCANSCCRVPLGLAGDLQVVSRGRPLAEGPPWAKLAFKYLLEELATSTRTVTESGLPSRHINVGRYAPDRASSFQGNFGTGTTLENTLLAWLQEAEILRPDQAVEIQKDTDLAREREMWVINTTKISNRKAECKTCNVNGTQVATPESPCNNWSCVMSRCFPDQLVPLLEDEHASLAKLKLESRLLLTPSSLAFVSTYIKPLLRTRRRLVDLLKVKQEEAFQAEASSAELAQQNRMKQQHSHMVDKFVGWLLCGGPVRHIVGFRIFDFHVFPRDSLVEIAGHTDAQRVYFWRLASSNTVPRNPLDFPKKLSGGPVLSFCDALALGQSDGTEGAERNDSGALHSPNVFFAAARYIHNYEKGVLQKDLETSITFVEHLSELIARNCTWTAEKFHLKDSEMYQKFFIDSWDIFRSVSAGNNAASAHQQQAHFLGHGRQNSNEGRQPMTSRNNEDFTRALRTVLTASSPDLQGALIPSDLFDWQVRLLQKQRNAVVRELETALPLLPKEWVDGDWTMSRIAEEQSTIWRWSADEEETKQQQEATRAAQEERKAEEKERKMKELKELRKRLELEALESSKRIRHFR
ncbi:uncharacterized protein EMH_0088900 [Eimeria mitis]|uniref:ATP-dependent RNA helicase n=1 Tax=Eimeria mitis TaxID=44415 RepID=U6JPX8_9EIME|nr:uncharacterized protein EMH_0088900 [Eimeria mitis]CDJ27565.1 hypothetical protein, conserved [Eimeria mitis]